MKKQSKDVFIEELKVSTKQDEPMLIFYNAKNEILLKIENTGKITFSDITKKMNTDAIAKEFINIVEKNIL